MIAVMFRELVKHLDQIRAHRLVCPLLIKTKPLGPYQEARIPQTSLIALLGTTLRMERRRSEAMEKVKLPFRPIQQIVQVRLVWT